VAYMPRNSPSRESPGLDGPGVSHGLVRVDVIMLRFVWDDVVFPSVRDLMIKIRVLITGLESAQSPVHLDQTR
jgi:hypothetical protein